MFKNARFALAAAFVATLALPALAEDAPAADAVTSTATADTVIARVGGVDITLGNAIALRTQLPQQFAQVPDATLFPAVVQQLIEQEVLAQSHADNLSHREQILLQNENRNFIANSALVAAVNAAVTDESIAAAYDAFAAQYAAGDPEFGEYRLQSVLGDANPT